MATKPRLSGIFLPGLAACISFSISGILIFLTVSESKLTAYGMLSPAQRTLYTTATTIFGTILTAFIISQIVTTLIHRIDDKFVPIILAGGTDQVSLSHIASSWSSILGLVPLWVRLTSRNWGSTLILITSGLTTTCVTSGFTPTTALKQLEYSSQIPSGDATIFARPYELNQMPDPPASYNHSSWLMSNGSIFYSWTGRGGSPAHEGMALSHGINIRNPDMFAYVDDGVAVDTSAIATPYSIYASQPQEGHRLSHLLQQYGSNIQNVSACVPVMVRNPFKCRKGAKMDWIDNDSIMRLYSEDGACMVKKTVRNVNDTEMLKWWCTHDSIGQATLLLGANFNYHAWLAVAINDEEIPPYQVPPRYTYSIQCEVDARNVFEYRQVTLSLSASQGNGHGFSRGLTSSGYCTPNHFSTIRDVLLATAATANHFLLTENVGNSGWFETINALTTRSGGYGLSAENSPRSPPWAFNDSSNALEDILGLTAAMVTSRIYRNSSLVDANGIAVLRYTRIGPGKLFALVYAVPPLLSGFVLVYLLIKEKGRHDYTTSRLLDIINLGKVCADSVQTTAIPRFG